MEGLLSNNYVLMLFRDRNAWRRHILFWVAFFLYVIMAAPTVLWSDNAGFQLQMGIGAIPMTPTGHPLWAFLACFFRNIPFGDVAYRANLMTAFFGACTLVLVAAIGQRLTGSYLAGICSAVILGTAHMYWEHCERVTTYTLNTLFFTAVWHSLLKWRDEKKMKWLTISVFLWTVSLGNHLLMSLCVPVFVVFVLANINNTFVRLKVVFGFFLLALALLTFTIINQSAWNYIIQAVDIVGFYIWPPHINFKTFIWAIVLLVYNFPLTLGLSFFSWVLLWKKNRIDAIFTVTLIIVYVSFPLLLNKPDVYHFYLPAYVVIAILCSFGVSFFEHRLGKKRIVILTLSVVVFSVFLYRITPNIMNKYNLKIPSVRDIPGRNTTLFFLWPPKWGYYGAREFGEKTLESPPQNAFFFADGTIAHTLFYLQQVEGKRQDIWIMIDVPTNLQRTVLLLEAGRRPVFLAHTQKYYNIPDIERSFDIIPHPPIFELIRKPTDILR